MKEEFNLSDRMKEPYKTICGICAGYIGESDNSEGELSYDGCEDYINTDERRLR